MRLYLSQGLILVTGALCIALCALLLYLTYALARVLQALRRSPQLPQVPRDGTGRPLKERL